MKQNTITYETGATSHAVNDLILFTDNTRELAEKRDSIYKMATEPGIYTADLKVNGPVKAFHTLSQMFTSLLREAVAAYKKEFPTSHSHIAHMYHWSKDGEEYCQLYAKGFDDWKRDRGYK
jgi:hypothetical protein